MLFPGFLNTNGRMYCNLVTFRAFPRFLYCNFLTLRAFPRVPEHQRVPVPTFGHQLRNILCISVLNLFTLHSFLYCNHLTLHAFPRFLYCNLLTLHFFLQLPGFLNTNESPFQRSVTNYGLMDQIAALHWVTENVAAFGGDQTNVTIFGHGTGAACINLLMTSRAVPKSEYRSF